MKVQKKRVAEKRELINHQIRTTLNTISKETTPVKYYSLLGIGGIYD